MFINARDNETMPVMNDEVPDEGDYDAGRAGRGEFDNITPEDFIHGGGSGHGNPPGWLGQPTSTGRVIRCPSHTWRSCPCAPMRWAASPVWARCCAYPMTGRSSVR